MSHIVRGKVAVNYVNTELLLRALSEVGLLMENERLYRVGVGYTSERYPLVLVDPKDKERRIGFRQENGVWVQYQEDYGSYGLWTQKTSNQVQDYYLAYHYEKVYQAEGYEVTVVKQPGGGIEVVAEEVVW